MIKVHEDTRRGGQRGFPSFRNRRLSIVLNVIGKSSRKGMKRSPESIIKMLGITLVHALAVKLDCSELKSP